MSNRIVRSVAKSVAAGLVLVLATGSVIAAESPPTTLKDLVDNGQYQEAYSLGLAAQERFEGDQVFDFNFGLAALETGNYSDAIYALERVLFVRPDGPRLRLELARAYYLAGDFTSARREFNNVLADNPPANVRSNIDAFMANMDAAENAAGRRLTLYIESYAGDDSNINAATSDAAISTPIGLFALSENGREQDDTYITYGGGLAYSQKLDDRATWDASFVANKRDNWDSSDFDVTTLRAESGISWVRDNSDNVRIGLRAQNTILDSDRFQTSVGVIGSYGHSFGDGWAEGWTATLTGAASALRYKDDHDRDTDQYLLAITGSRPFGRFTHALTLYGAGEPSHNGGSAKHNGRDFFGANYIVQFALNDRILPFFGLTAQSTEYDDDHPVFVVERDDDLTAARLGFYWNPIAHLSVRGEYRYTDVSSNIAVFDYDRSEFELGARWTF